ncbi:WXG100 family type VII secretion target [Streptomyces sp. NPDC023723]|uniref:WXG100 family type VII secretion target n=1 Tax=Streptomyces sp. NPDC023723 TaxID=3154323 RepID=UPI0033F912E4
MPEMSPGEFRVALGELRSAIGVVRGERQNMSDLTGQIQNRFEAARESWQSPSGVTFETISEWFTKASHDLLELLEETARRMQAAYDNYADAETANTRNLGG